MKVDDTDAEGRLVLAGGYHFNCFLSGTLKLALRRVALCFDRAEVAYSHLRCHSHCVCSSPEPLDRAMAIALGEIHPGVFTHHGG